MFREKIIPIAKGLIKHIPGVKTILPSKTGGASSDPEYCYTVWIIHLKYWADYNEKPAQVVAEIGPGNSLGLCFAALLSGSEKAYAFDVVKYWDSNENLKIFNGLVKIFKRKGIASAGSAYPNVEPKIEDYGFPSHIITDKILEESLHESRLDKIREEILDIDNPENQFIKYHIPWYGSNVIDTSTVDLIFSQAVLEHVEDLDNTYISMYKWLKPSGMMSHTIDFKSHGITKSWNGHWSFSDFEWKLVKGGKSFLINRQPFSKHKALHAKHDFNIVLSTKVFAENNLRASDLSKTFKNLTEEDITTSGAYILSFKHT